jgi:hypothetical protein
VQPQEVGSPVWLLLANSATRLLTAGDVAPPELSSMIRVCGENASQRDQNTERAPLFWVNSTMVPMLVHASPACLAASIAVYHLHDTHSGPAAFF